MDYKDFDNETNLLNYNNLVNSSFIFVINIFNDVKLFCLDYFEYFFLEDNDYICDNDNDNDIDNNNIGIDIKNK